MSVRIPPRPGDRCIYCRQEILENDAWYGGKGDYWHMRCFNAQVQEELENGAQRKMIYASRASDHKWQYEVVADNDYDQAVEEYEDGKYDYNPDFRDGYNLGYDQGQRDNVARSVAESEIKAVNDILTMVGVPLIVDPTANGHGVAGRLAWFLDRQGYVIQELGNPDALA